MDPNILFVANITTTLALLAIIFVSLPWSQADLKELTGRVAQVKSLMNMTMQLTNQVATICRKKTTTLWRINHQRYRAIITQ